MSVGGRTAGLKRRQLPRGLDGRLYGASSDTRGPSTADLRPRTLHGATCAVCGFKLRHDLRGTRQGYIEAHHLTLFADLQGRPTELSPRDDFAVLCASCHRMVHRRRTPYELDDVRAALKAQVPGSG